MPLHMCKPYSYLAVLTAVCACARSGKNYGFIWMIKATRYVCTIVGAVTHEW